MSRFFSTMSRNYRVFPGKISKCPDSRRNLQIPGTILTLSRNSVCQSCHPTYIKLSILFSLHLRMMTWSHRNKCKTPFTYFILKCLLTKSYLSSYTYFYTGNSMNASKTKDLQYEGHLKLLSKEHKPLGEYLCSVYSFII